MAKAKLGETPLIEPVYKGAGKEHLLRFELRGDAHRGAIIATCDTLVRTLEITTHGDQDQVRISLPLSPMERDVALHALKLYWLVLGRDAEDKNAEAVAERSDAVSKRSESVGAAGRSET